MKMIISCTEEERDKWLDYNLENSCPFHPFYQPECGEDSDCYACIENNVEFEIID